MTYQVIVGNIGTVHDGSNYRKAYAVYSAYVKQSKDQYGRAGGESVVLMDGGEIRHEYIGTIQQSAKTKTAFDARDDVRLRIQYDETPYDDSFIDTWTDQSEQEREKYRKELWARIERDGVVGVIGEWFDGDEWQEADAVWGFVGDDWKESGYDYDIMRTTLDAAIAHEHSQLLQGAV